jgi:hypothetical protein
MKRLWIYIILCSLSLDQVMAQSGIGLINTELRGPLGTGRKILQSYHSSQLHYNDTNHGAKSNQMVCPTSTLPQKDSIKSEYLFQQTLPRKIDKSYKLKIIIKDFLKRTISLIRLFRNIT